MQAPKAQTIHGIDLGPAVTIRHRRAILTIANR